MIQIIIVGHGNFARGIKSNLGTIMGIPKNVSFINLKGRESAATIYNKYEHIEYTSPQGIIFLTDIAGGTPYNQAVFFLLATGIKGAVVGVVNIPLIIRILEQLNEKSDPMYIVSDAKRVAIESIKISGNLTELVNLS